MAVKEWVRQLQPVQLYFVLTLTVVFFITELVASHITHALTLLMDSYNMLCNIIALTGCIITVKYGSKSQRWEHQANTLKDASNGEELKTVPTETSECVSNKVYTISSGTQENKLKNTFGWARIDVLVMLICCVFHVSLSFSLVVEALQTLVHIDHHDEMHFPLIVLCIGAAGMLLNGICYLMIGGYTFHQGSFLHITSSGDVVLDRVVTKDSIKKGERRLSRTREVRVPPQHRQRQGFREMSRDVLGSVLVIICSLIVYMSEEDVAKFVDPALSIVAAVVLIILSYPYMKESCLILLQTIPNSINIDSLKNKLLEAFPDIINIHDLHIWQLTASKVISTAHIIFQNPKVYARISEEINDFFFEHGITQCTIQPEFFVPSETTSLVKACKPGTCLMQCQSEGCLNSHCCPINLPKTLETNSTWLSLSREQIPYDINVDLKAIKVTGEDMAGIADTQSKTMEKEVPEKPIEKQDSAEEESTIENSVEKTDCNES